MRRQRSGNVVNISSVGGYAGYAGWGVYRATKFAVQGLSKAMTAELAPLGVHVTVVEPGFFRTDFLDDQSLSRTRQEISDYPTSSVRPVVWQPTSIMPSAVIRQSLRRR